MFKVCSVSFDRWSHLHDPDSAHRHPEIPSSPFTPASAPLGSWRPPIHPGLCAAVGWGEFPASLCEGNRGASARTQASLFSDHRSFQIHHVVTRVSAAFHCRVTLHHRRSCSFLCELCSLCLSRGFLFYLSCQVN